MSKWDEMSDRERDAWVAVNLFDWRWMRFDGSGGHPKQHVACIPPDAPRRQIFNFPRNLATRVSYEESHPRFSDWDKTLYRDHSDFRAPEVGFPHYTTDASADYLVLCKVRKEWERIFERASAFNQALFDIWNVRAGRFDVWEPEMYEPGDYSHAAFLALEGK